MLWSGSNPETLETWRNLYFRPKALLILLLILIAPSYSPPREIVKLAQPSAYDLAPTTTVDEPAASPSALPLTELSSQSQPQDAESITSQNNLQGGEGKAAMRGYTSEELDNLTYTVSVSPPPSSSLPASSSVPSSPACTETDERGRLLCDREANRISFEERLAEVEQDARLAVKSVEQSVLGFFRQSNNSGNEVHRNLGLPESMPWINVIVFLCIVGGLELVSLAAEDEIVKRSFTSSPKPEFQRSTSLSKHLLLAKFHVVHSFKHNFLPLVALSGILLFITFIALQMWRGAYLNAPEGVVTPKGLGGLDYPRLGRVVIFLECVTCFFTLFQPIKHLIPQSVLPKTISPPFYNSLSRLSPPKKPVRNVPTSRRRPRHSFERQRSSTFFEGRDKHRPKLTEPVGVVVETKWAISVGVEALAVTMGLIQYIAIAFTLRSLYPHSPTVLFTILCLRSRVSHFRRVCGFYNKTVECLRLVLNSFPFFDEDEDDEDWRCSICFEGAEREEGADDENGEWGGKRCRLDCGHVLHADCLITWLHFQSFCCVCTAPIT